MQTDNEVLAKTLEWIKDQHRVIGDTMLIPLINHDEKRPMVMHKKQGSWGLTQLSAYMKKNPQHTAYGLLLDSICVVDADTSDAVSALERAAEEDPDIWNAMEICPVQQTKKGRHYFFARPKWADECKFYDGARQSPLKLDLDLKTICATGTRGVLVVAPTKGKSWVPGREPWAPNISLVDIPRSLMDMVAKPRVVNEVKQQRVTKKVDATASSPSSSVKPKIVSNQEVRTLVDMLSPERVHNYASWMQLGWCLHNIDAVDLLDAWVTASKRSPKFKAGECEQLWSTMTSGNIKLGSLHHWARQDNEHEYKAFMNKTVDIKWCNGSHNSVAKFASVLLKSHHVCASSNGKLWYNFDGTLWQVDNDAIRLKHELSSTVVNHVMMAMHRIVGNIAVDDMQSGTSTSSEASEAKRTSEHLLKIAYKLQDRYFKESVVLELREFLYDKTFVQRLDSDRNLVAFTNGVWDLERHLFRAACPEDMLRHSTGYNFIDGYSVSEEDSAIVERYWQTLHPNADQRSYVKKMFARQLYGDHGCELFHIHAGHRGTAANGKSKFFEILEQSFGSYVRKFGIELLTSKDRIEPGKPMPEFGNWAGVRILYCTEPNHDERLNTGLLKDFTGGEQISFRALFSNDVQQFRPQFKMHLMCNDTPAIDGSDSGVKRRVRKIDYVSRFVDAAHVNEDNFMFIRDDKLIQAFKTRIETKLAFFLDLVGNFERDYEFEMPESIRKNSNLYIEENDAIFSFVNDCVLACPGACFTLKEAKDVYRERGYPSGRSDTMKNDLQKALSTVCFKQKRVPSRANQNLTNVFLDFRLRGPDEDAASAFIDEEH